MKQLKLIAFFLLFVFSSCHHGVNDIAQEMANWNTLEGEYAGLGESEQYKKYEILKRNATTQQLENFIEQDSAALVCYAAFILMERNPQEVIPLFTKFIDEDKEVITSTGCLFSTSTIATEIYLHFRNTCFDYPDKEDYTNRIFNDNKELYQMDSIILFADKIPDYLLVPVLENRVYSATIQQRILALANQKLDFYAISYAFEHLKVGHETELMASLEAYSKKENLFSFEENKINEMLAQLRH